MDYRHADNPDPFTAERAARGDTLIERVTPRLYLVVEDSGCIVLADSDARRRHTITNVDALIRGLAEAREVVAGREDRAREARVMGRVRTPWTRVDDGPDKHPRWEMPMGYLGPDDPGHLITDAAIRAFGRRHVEGRLLAGLPPLPEEAWAVDTVSAAEAAAAERGASRLPHPAVILGPGPQLRSVIAELEAGTYPLPEAPVWRDDLPRVLAVCLARATGATEEQIAGLTDV